MTTVLVTGASGFVGSHVVLELLREGYTVRGPIPYDTLLSVLTPAGVVSTVRSHNVARVNKGYESFGDKFAAVVIDDLVTSDLLATVKGVDAIIHVASPLSISATPDVVLETAPPDERRLRSSQGVTGFDVYSVSKSLSDLTVRNFKQDHPDFDITTSPPVVHIRSTIHPATGTNRHIYALVAGAPGRPVNGYDPATRAPPLNVDLPPSESLRRFILSTSRFTWKDAVELLAEKRPELKERLPVITGNEPPVGPFATLDTSKTESVLGMRNYVKWQDTILAYR
ncbi:NAD-P-binding protein [Lactarius deliciosus]|nr:NAD-P-binding protein [Lactarius deliciosus]